MTPRNKVLQIIDLYDPRDIREVAEKSGFSYYEAFRICETLKEKGLIKDLALTNKGIRTLSAYDSDDRVSLKEFLQCAGIGLGYVVIGVCISFIITCLLG